MDDLARARAAVAATQPKPQEFKIGTETIGEYFDPGKSGYRVTRGELQTILGLFADKASMQQGLDRVAFDLRQAIKQLVANERAADESLAKEGRTEGGLIIAP